MVCYAAFGMVRYCIKIKYRYKKKNIYIYKSVLINHDILYVWIILLSGVGTLYDHQLISKEDLITNITDYHIYFFGD